jgi:DNA-binding NtrC family response regulator
VSRVHVRIEKMDDGYSVLDCRSRNGTWVNGQRIKKKALENGDKIRVGKTILLFLTDGAAEAAPPPADSRPSARPSVPVELRETLEAGLELVVRRFSARRALLAVLAGGAPPWRMAAYPHEDPAGPGGPPDPLLPVVEWVRATGRPVAVPDANEDDRFRAKDGAGGPRPVAAVPIGHGAELVGVLGIEGGSPVRELAALSQAAALFKLTVAEAWRELDRESRLRKAEEAFVATVASQVSAGQFGGMLGRSEAMREVFRRIQKVAATDLPVLIEGETGTGKELVARAIHLRSRHREGPFVAENCAAIASSVMESELFGHVRGAFTGAERDKAGLIEMAVGGSLFLDEVADMSEDLQKKLLRAIQERTIRRVGGSEPIPVDVRVIAASNRTLEDLVATGRFREDLYFRLNVLRVTLPPLRERTEDIVLLAEGFLAEIAARGGHPRKLSRDAVSRLLAYAWPGNVRELRNVMERAAALGEGDVITATDLGSLLHGAAAPSVEGLDFHRAKEKVVEAFEKQFLLEALLRHRGNVSAVAGEMGLERRHLYTLMERYALDPRAYRE